MLQMDLEDSESTMTSFDSQVEGLKATIEALEVQLAQNQTERADMEDRLEDSKAQVVLHASVKNQSASSLQPPFALRKENIPFEI